jgi:hypothetical protein
MVFSTKVLSKSEHTRAKRIRRPMDRIRVEDPTAVLGEKDPMNVHGEDAVSTVQNLLFFSHRPISTA